MKRAAFAAAACAAAAAPATVLAAQPDGVTWTLAWEDGFDAGLDPDAWSLIDKGQSQWCDTMVPSPDLAYVKDGVLHLLGRARRDADGNLMCETGGVRSRGKRSFLYGKIEFRARFGNVRGAWPAAWLGADVRAASLPGGEYGEIDVIERLNDNAFVYQTVHTKWTLAKKAGPRNGAKAVCNPGEWNVYAFEWLPEGKLVFSVNGGKVWEYGRTEDVALPEKWPFVGPYYMMFDMQLGGSWVGNVDMEDLYARPGRAVEMQVDWMRYYTGSRGGATFGRMFGKTYEWSENAPDADFSNMANWGGRAGDAFDPEGVYVFNVFSPPAVNVPANLSPASIVFDAGAPSISVSGAPFTGLGAVVNKSGRPQTFGNTVSFADAAYVSGSSLEAPVSFEGGATSTRPVGPTHLSGRHVFKTDAWKRSPELYTVRKGSSVRTDGAGRR